MQCITWASYRQVMETEFVPPASAIQSLGLGLLGVIFDRGTRLVGLATRCNPALSLHNRIASLVLFAHQSLNACAEDMEGSGLSSVFYSMPEDILVESVQKSIHAHLHNVVFSSTPYSVLKHTAIP